MLRAIAKYADKASPMIDVGGAIAKVAAYCQEVGRDLKAIAWTGGGQLFLQDDPEIQRRAIDWAIQQYGGTEEDIRRNGLFGSLADVIAGIQRLVDLGVGEVIVFQLPRVHAKSLKRFSDEVIPAFK